MENYCLSHGIKISNYKNKYLCEYGVANTIVDYNFIWSPNNVVNFNINNDNHMDLFAYLYIKNEIYNRMREKHDDVHVKFIVEYNIFTIDKIVFVIYEDNITINIYDTERIHKIMDLYPSIFIPRDLHLSFID